MTRPWAYSCWYCRAAYPRPAHDPLIGAVCPWCGQGVRAPTGADGKPLEVTGAIADTAPLKWRPTDRDLAIRTLPPRPGGRPVPVSTGIFCRPDVEISTPIGTIVIAGWLSSKIRSLYKRDGDRCWLCGEPVDPRPRSHTAWDRPTLDHVRPRHEKGSNALRNLRLAHKSCNEYRAGSEIKPFTSFDRSPEADRARRQKARAA